MASSCKIVFILVLCFINFISIRAVRFCFPATQAELMATCKKSHFGVFLSTHAVNKERKVGVYWYTEERPHENEIMIYAHGKKKTHYVTKNQDYLISSLTVGDDILNERLGQDPFKYEHTDKSFFAKWFHFESAILDPHPTWMADRKNFLGDKRLNEIFIPGTHNSAAYNYMEVPYTDKIAAFAGPYYGSSKIYNQNEDIFYQLIFGARYLDIRPIYSNDSENKFHCASPAIRLPFETLASQVRRFLNNTEEIVILGLSQFSKFTNQSIHEEFIEYLKILFSGYIIEKNDDTIGWQSNLNTLWATGGKLIISYDNIIAKNHTSLWEPVERILTKTDEICFLEGYLEAVYSLKRNEYKENSPPTAVIAALKNAMLRKGLPEEMSYRMTIHYLTNDTWGNSANIVAVNFLLSTGIVDAAIEWNIKRYRKYRSNKIN